EPSRSVHRREPAAEMAHHAEHASDHVEDRLAHAARLRAEIAKHAADEIAVMPLFIFDLMDARALAGIRDAVPVAAIRERRRELAGIGVLQLPDQLRAGVHHADSTCEP